MTDPSRRSAIAFYTGVFLLCMSVLMLQIIQTRILSVTSLYYMAFLSISMAMLGLTAGALVVYFLEERFGRSNMLGMLARITSAYALCILVAFLLQLASSVPLIRWATVIIVWLKLILILAAPFVFAGMAISLALTRSAFPVGIVYGVDLLGAASGCLLVLLLLNWMDAPSAIFAVAGIAALAAVCFSRAGRERDADHPFLRWRLLRRPGWIAIALFVLAGVNASVQDGLQPIADKFGETEQRQDFAYEKWNSFSRVVVYRAHAGPPFLWGPSPTLPPGQEIEERKLNIDGFASTSMPHFTGDLDRVGYLRYDITNLAYAARHAGRAAVIGVGGGRDLLSAWQFGFRDITGVELNPTFVDLLTDPAKLRGFAGIADLPGVRLVVDEGRSWFTRTGETFDLLQMSMIDTFASTGVGAFSLSENGLYTVEGWRIFLSALKPNGLFTVSRWHAPENDVEIGRVTSLAMAGLFALGVEHPRDRIFIATVGSLATMIVSRAPFTQADLQALGDAAERYRFQVLVRPDQPIEAAIFRDLLSATGRDELDRRASGYFLDVSAPTDSRPFFFNHLKIGNLDDLAQALRALRGSGDVSFGPHLVVLGNLLATGILLLVIVLSAVVVVAAIILPARFAIHQTDRRLVCWGSWYLLLIGLGFMFVEIGLIQRISVFLGHPTYGLGIVLFSIILSTGLGSMLSERFPLSRTRDLLIWLAALVLYVVLLPSWLPELTHSSLQAAGLAVRAVASVAVILPAGLLMGFGFPTGMRLVMAWDTRPAPWFWSINGAAGVLAAGLAVICSLATSIDTTVRVSGVCYLALLPAALALRGSIRR